MTARTLTTSKLLLAAVEGPVPAAGLRVKARAVGPTQTGLIGPAALIPVVTAERIIPVIHDNLLGHEPQKKTKESKPPILGKSG